MSPTSNGHGALKVAQAAEFLGVHPETVRRLARKGEIPAFKVGKDWRFQREALVRWIEAHQLSGRRPCVLAVDDEEIVRHLISEVLEVAGFVVHTAQDGEAGLRHVEEHAPDMVLLDLQMPKMNGPEFLRRFRPDHPDTPVIIVTAYPESDLMLEAMRQGPLGLLAKPIESDRLIKAVHVTLAGAARSRAV